MKGAGHERIIRWRVCKGNQTGAKLRIDASKLLDDSTHSERGLDVDARFGRSDVHGGTHFFCRAQCLRNRAHKCLSPDCKAFLDEGRVATDKVDVQLRCSFIHRACNQWTRLWMDVDQGANRSYRDALVYYRQRIPRHRSIGF